MGSRVCYRQCNCEGGTLPGPTAFGRDLAAMHIDDTLDDRKTQARRALAGRGLGGPALEAPEQPAKIFRRKAGALVDDADRGLVAFLADLHRNPAADRAV